MKYVYRHGKLVPKDEAQYVGVTRLRSKMSYGGQARARPSKPEGRSRGPYVIRDEMEPTEQVNGQFYTSKAKFRAKGRELGLIEVGNEKFPPRQRPSDSRVSEEKRIQSIKKALAQWASR